MIIKVGNREIAIQRVDSRLTTLQISRIETDGKVSKTSIVNLDKAETSALIAALKVEAPKE
jgi:hypothetical protein